MMIGWSVVFVGVAIVVVGLLSLRDRRQRIGERQAMPPPAAPPDFTHDREAARLTHMSADDRDWETACLQRQQARPERAKQQTDATGAD